MIWSRVASTQNVDTNKRKGHKQRNNFNRLHFPTTLQAFARSLELWANNVVQTTRQYARHLQVL